MTFPFGTTVTLITRSVIGRDGDGNDIYQDVQTVLPGCAFDPGGSTELVQGQDLVTTTPTLYAPAGTVIGPVDAILVAGQTFEVDGTPNTYTNPFTGWQPGVVVKLRAVTG